MRTNLQCGSPLCRWALPGARSFPQEQHLWQALWYRREPEHSHKPSASITLNFYEILGWQSTHDLKYNPDPDVGSNKILNVPFFTQNVTHVFGKGLRRDPFVRKVVRHTKSWDGQAEKRLEKAEETIRQDRRWKANFQMIFPSVSFSALQCTRLRSKCSQVLTVEKKWGADEIICSLSYVCAGYNCF